MAGQITYFMIMLCSAVVLGQTNVDFIHYESLDGKKCTTPLFSIGVPSGIACAAKCNMDAACKSQFFIPGTKECIGCDGIYETSDVASMVAAPGTLYYRPYGQPRHNLASVGAFYHQTCSNTDKPCIDDNNVCFPGLDTCVCDPLFMYNPSTTSCISDCATLGEEFQRYPSRSLYGNDGTHHTNQNDPANCQAYCTSVTTFTCYGIDFDHVRNICFYNNVKVSAVPAAWTVDDCCYDYVRNCA